MLCVLVKFLSHASAEKKKKASGFQMSDFHWAFSCDIMAVKWLKTKPELEVQFMPSLCQLHYHVQQCLPVITNRRSASVLKSF